MVITMAKVNPQEFAKKWSQRTTQAIPEFQAGVMRVTVAPGIKASERADAYLMGVQKAVSERKWQDNVAAVPLNEWQQKTAQLGGQRIGSGVAAAETKMQAFGNALLPFQETLKSNLDSQTPRGDLEQNINRMTSWVRGMSQFKKPTGS